MPQPRTMIDAEIIIRGVPQDLIIAGESLELIREEAREMLLYKHIESGEIHLRIVNFWRGGVQVIKGGEICPAS